jgi:hypothetical protein
MLGLCRLHWKLLAMGSIPGSVDQRLLLERGARRGRSGGPNIHTGGRGHKNYYSGVRLLKIEVAALHNWNGTLGKWNGSPVSFSRRYFASGC